MGYIFIDIFYLPFYIIIYSSNKAISSSRYRKQYVRIMYILDKLKL